jgi:hypothetical protein
MLHINQQLPITEATRPPWMTQLWALAMIRMLLLLPQLAMMLQMAAAVGGCQQLQQVWPRAILKLCGRSATFR